MSEEKVTTNSLTLVLLRGDEEIPAAPRTDGLGARRLHMESVKAASFLLSAVGPCQLRLPDGRPVLTIHAEALASVALTPRGHFGEERLCLEYSADGQPWYADAAKAAPAAPAPGPRLVDVGDGVYQEVHD